MTRLYRALSLRQTGLRLEQIAALLAGNNPAPAATLLAHLRRLDAELTRRGQLRDRLAEILEGLDHADARLGEDPDGVLLMRVISTMTMFESYVHGYRTSENERLHNQAGTLVELLHADTAYPRGCAVLEVGCGVGAQTVTLAQRSPGARITSIDISATSLAEARRRVAAAGLGNVEFHRADVFALPAAGGALRAGLFDYVFVCFLLEHLPRPVEALVGLRAMLRPGGSITVIEGDHGSAYFHPDSTAARDAISCQITLQRQAGGDALIGRGLRPLLVTAGYEGIDVSPRMVYVDASRPDLVEGFTRRTFTAMIEGVREPAIAAGLTEPDYFDAGVVDLLRTTEPDGVFCYTFFKATAHAPLV